MSYRRGGYGGYRRYGSRSDTPKPVKVGEEYDVEINEVGSKGDGIAKVKNFVVFVSGAKQGEKLKIKITDVRDRFAIAEKVTGAEAEAEGTGAKQTLAEEAPKDVEDVKDTDEDEEDDEEDDEEEDVEEDDDVEDVEDTEE